ncbi:MAG: glutamate 5-kinase [Lachnospiraceae bacterium]|nr:glutamate 5-kinase [Lachnospiraceae bacterium]
MDYREALKNKKKIVVKVGSSTIVHEETGRVNYDKLEHLVRILCDIKNQGRDVILVSSGAIGVGFNALGLSKRPKTLSLKQACAAVGQGQLMMIYQKIFSEYHQTTAQVLLTKRVLTNDKRRQNVINTFNELMQLDVIPVVNENDTISTHEIEFGDNDTLSAVVASLVEADLLILLSDIDGVYEDDPHNNPDAKMLDTIKNVTDDIMNMAKDSQSLVGTGGMITKFHAADIANSSGCDMVITNGADLNNLQKVLRGENVGTLFVKNKINDFDMKEYLND